MNKAIKIISYLLLLSALAGIIGLVAKFTGGFTGDFKTFYVTVDGKDVLSAGSGYFTAPDTPLKVDVKYTFGAFDKDMVGYSVKIYPNVRDGKDFIFTVDGETKQYHSEADLTSGFEITESEKSFEVKPKGGTLQEILQAVYPQKTVVCESDVGYSDMFVLVVTSYNGESSVKINFTLASKVTGIKLDKEVIIF